MGTSRGTINLEEITQEKIEKLYKFLQGEMPPDIHMKRHPKLSSRMAFSIIWFIQEELEILPDRYERCKTCGRIFDSYSEGDTKLHCDSCRKD